MPIWPPRAARHWDFDVDDRPAFESWATDNFTVVGDAFAYVVTAAGAPWTRALFWFEDERLHLETSSIDRWFHLEVIFERLWPPVFRGMCLFSPLDEHLDASYRPLWPQPPGEASVFTRLVPPQSCTHG